MSFEKYLRQKQIEKEAKEAAYKSVNEVIGKMMRSEFQEWYFKEKYLGIEPIDHAQAAWQHQQEKLDELQNRINISQDIIESILARSLDNPEIQELCCDLIDVLDGFEGAE